MCLSVGSIGGHMRPLELGWKTNLTIASTGKQWRSEGAWQPLSGMFGAAERGGGGVAVKVTPLLSSVLLWEGPQCLLQQEETEGQSTDLLSSCLCDRRMSILFYNLCGKHTCSKLGKKEKDK